MEISRKYRKQVKFFLILENIIIIDVSTTGFMYVYTLQYTTSKSKHCCTVYTGYIIINLYIITG